LQGPWDSRYFKTLTLGDHEDGLRPSMKYSRPMAWFLKPEEAGESGIIKILSFVTVEQPIL